MSIQITHVRLAGGSGHEHITDYRWRNQQSGETGESNKPAMVEWVDGAANHAYVGTGAVRSEAGVVRPQHGQPFLRTYADGVWNNNLLALPRF